MFILEAELDDTLLPDAETMLEMAFEDEESSSISPHSPDDFNEEPESMALWIEKASLQFTV